MRFWVASLANLRPNKKAAAVPSCGTAAAEFTNSAPSEMEPDCELNLALA